MFCTQTPLAVLALSLMLAGNCAGELPPAGEIEPQTEAEPETPMITAAGTTVELRPDATLEQFLREAGPARSLRLTINGVVPPSSAESAVNVFINLPQADFSTPTDDPHFAGSFTFFMGPEGPRPQDFLLDAGPVLRRLESAGELTLQQPLQITLVAVPLSPGAETVPEIPFERVTLSPGTP